MRLEEAVVGKVCRVHGEGRLKVGNDVENVIDGVGEGSGERGKDGRAVEGDEKVVRRGSGSEELGTDAEDHTLGFVREHR